MDRVETNVATNLFFFVFLFIKGGGNLARFAPVDSTLTYVRDHFKNYPGF